MAASESFGRTWQKLGKIGIVCCHIFPSLPLPQDIIYLEQQ
jgi:hypothetical protein